MEPTHLLREGARVEPLGYFMAVSFHPNIRLDKKSAFNFAATLSDYIDTQNVQLESNQWTLRSVKDTLEIVLTSRALQLHAANPVHKRGWYEARYMTVLKRLEELSKPELILESKAMIRGLLHIDGDARDFLGSHVMNMEPQRLEPMGRPLHVLGMRMFFPPYVVKEQEQASEGRITEWGVNVKLESWIEDTSKLFVEADASWPRPAKWGESSLDEVAGRLATLEDYLEKHIVPFLAERPDQDQENG